MRILHVLLAVAFLLALPVQGHSQENDDLVEVGVCQLPGDEAPWIRILQRPLKRTVYVETRNGTEELFEAEKRHVLQTNPRYKLSELNSDMAAFSIGAQCIGGGRVMYVDGAFNYFGNSVKGVLFSNLYGQTILRMEASGRVPPILFYQNKDEMKLVYPNPYGPSDNSEQYRIFTRKIGEDKTTVQTAAGLPPKKGFTVIKMPNRFGFE